MDTGIFLLFFLLHRLGADLAERRLAVGRKGESQRVHEWAVGGSIAPRRPRRVYCARPPTQVGHLFVAWPGPGPGR
jgi:hypothetical protein